MKACLLALMMFAFLPGMALAHPPSPSDANCGLAHVNLQNSGHCVSGTVMFRDQQFMAVRPQHGSLKLVVSTRDTIHETSSGAAVLEGLVQGDFVCVAGYQEDGILVADAITFDVRPFSCS